MADIIIIGSGLAGVTAALSAREQGASVLLLDRHGLGLGSNSSLANGVFCGPTSDYTPKAYAADTIEAGRGLNQASRVWTVAREFIATRDWLAGLGVELAAAGGYYVYQTPRQDVFRGASLMRALCAGLKTGTGVRCLPGFHVNRILTTQGRVAGVSGWDGQGRGRVLPAAAVVLATGGAGAVYQCNDNQKSALGQGYLLAARAGLDLYDMEFVQFYPLVMAQAGLPPLMLYPPYPAQARLTDAKGDDLLAKLGIGDINQAIMLLRDQFSARLHQEGQAGPVYLDYSGVPQPAWSRYPLTLQTRLRHDFRRLPVAISPGAHFCMGGVAVDGRAMTGLPGLFACGEVTWGLHGANRRGGNALSECIVSGRQAGRSAAALARDTGRYPPLPADAPPPATSPITAPPPPVRRELLAGLRRLAWRKAGIVRQGPDMERGLEELAAWELDLAQAAQGPGDQRWQEDLTAAALFLRCVLLAGLGRKESRGALLRTDHPQQDDAHWLRNSRLSWDGETENLALTYQPLAEGERGEA
jgi:succinate dehydrogenase/fumarate reductase flavoprotein subunit